jgi:hypothetical protein
LREKENLNILIAEEDQNLPKLQNDINNVRQEIKTLFEGNDEFGFPLGPPKFSEDQLF